MKDVGIVKKVKMVKRKRKSSRLGVVIQLMGLLQGMNNQELIRLRSMVDEELVYRQVDLRELRMNRRKLFIKFIHWLKYGRYH